MEFGRFAQTGALKNKGWTVSDDCQRLQRADRTMGGPTYMADPEGRIHAVSAGSERPLEGLHKVWLQAPEGQPEEHSLKAWLFKDGRVLAVQG